MYTLIGVSSGTVITAEPFGAPTPPLRLWCSAMDGVRRREPCISVLTRSNIFHDED